MKTKRMRRNTTIGIVAGVLAAGLIITPSSQAAGTIKIGFINATIGPFAGPAPEITKGLNLALKEINSTVNGKKIVIIEEASDATPQLALEKAQAEKAAQDRELNRVRQEKAERKARMTQLWQLVEQHRVPRVDSDEYFNFVHANKVHRIGVDTSLRERIQSGQVIIVRYGKFYAPVLPEIANRVKALDPEALVDLNSTSPTDSTATDDTYKDYVVPDDLMW